MNRPRFIVLEVVGYATSRGKHNSSGLSATVHDRAYGVDIATYRSETRVGTGRRGGQPIRGADRSRELARIHAAELNAKHA